MGLEVTSSLEEIEQHTMAGVDFLAPNIATLGLQPPLDDVELFATHLQGKKILDAGCGDAYYVDEFIKRGLEYTGIDLSQKMIDICRKAHPALTFKQMSFRSLHFNDETFDGVWCCCVFLHEPKRNMPAVLAELRRVLKPGGLLSVVIPYTEYGDESVATLKTNEQLELLWTHWELGSFLIELEKAGFIVIDAFPRYESGSSSFLAQK